MWKARPKDATEIVAVLDARDKFLRLGMLNTFSFFYMLSSTFFFFSLTLDLTLYFVCKCRYPVQVLRRLGDMKELILNWIGM